MSTSLVDVNRWRRMGWPRIIMYFLCIVLVIHLFHTFSSSISSTSSPSSASTTVTIEQEDKPLPWYKSPHPKLTSLQNPSFTTANLTTEARLQLTADMVLKAKEAVKVEDFATSIRGIPGSIFNGKPAEANQFRKLVDCWTTGEWVAVPHKQNLMSHFQDPLYGSCDRKFKKHAQDEEQREAVKYVWKSSCDMVQQVDSANWCQVLHGRHLLLVGDLVQYQLHELFLDTLRDGPTVCYGELNCKDHTVCSEPDFAETRLRYLRNDILSVRRKMDQNHGHPKADVIEWPFTNSALMRGYPILILNRAPVIETDEQFIKGLIQTFRTLRKANANTLLIYRSTGIGHPFCDDATGPLEQPLTDDQLKQLPFGWSEIARRNEIARVIVEAAGGLFLDLAKLTDIRPDGHIGGNDCLRYCIPGPLDSWAQVLYQIFLGLDGQ